MLKAGTLIDATLVEVAVARPPLSEGEVSTRDPDAGFTRRGQKSFFGFKAHLAVDPGTDLVRGAILTGAEVGDSLVADAVIQGDEAARGVRGQSLRQYRPPRGAGQGRRRRRTASCTASTRAGGRCLGSAG